MARKRVATRAEFKQWLKSRWDKTIGKQEDSSSCAIAQFLIEKYGAVDCDVGSADEWGYYDKKKDEMVWLPKRAWVGRVIDKFDALPGTPKGCDLLKALGWGHVQGR